MKKRAQSRKIRSAVCALCALAGVCAIRCAPVFADATGQGGDPVKTRFVIDDADPESAVPSPKEALEAPLQMGYWVMLVADRAEEAEKRGDLMAAAKYYRAIAKAAPDRAIGFSRACELYEKMGDRDNALATCRVALQKGGATLDDYARFVRVLLSKPGRLAAADVADADAVIGHVEEQLGGPQDGDASTPQPERARSAALIGAQLKCELGARLGDEKRLQACASTLQKLAPHEPTTQAYAFALALAKHDFDGAQRLIEGAPSAGINESGVSRMQERLRAELASVPLFERVFRGHVLAFALAGVLLSGLGLLYRMRRSHSPRTA